MIICTDGTQRSPYTATQILAVGKTPDTVPSANSVAYTLSDERGDPVGSVLLQRIEDWQVLRPFEFLVTVNPWGLLARGGCWRNACCVTTWPLSWCKWKQQGDQSKSQRVDLMLEPNAITSTWVFFFWPHPQHVEVLGQGMEAVTQLQPEPLSWQRRILNLLHHKRTPNNVLFSYPEFPPNKWKYSLIFNGGSVHCYKTLWRAVWRPLSRWECSKTLTQPCVQSACECLVQHCLH